MMCYASKCETNCIENYCLRDYIQSPLIFVSFSRLENSETKFRNEIKLSETKLSGDIIFTLAIIFKIGLPKCDRCDRINLTANEA